MHAEHLQGAMQAMADGDIACSIEAVGARLSASQASNAFLTGMLIAGGEVTSALEAQIQELSASFAAAATRAQDLARRLHDEEEATRNKDQRIKALEQAAMDAAIGFADSKEALQQSLARVHAELDATRKEKRRETEEREQALVATWQAGLQSELDELKATHEATKKQMRDDMAALQAEHMKAFKQAHLMNQKHEEDLLKQLDLLRQERIDLHVALKKHKEDKRQQAEALMAAQAEIAGMHDRVKAAERECVRAVMMTDAERPIFMLRKEAEVLSRSHQLAQAEHDADKMLHNKMEIVSRLEQTLVQIMVHLEAALVKASAAQRTKDAVLTLLRPCHLSSATFSHPTWPPCPVAYRCLLTRLPAPHAVAANAAGSAGARGSTRRW